MNFDQTQQEEPTTSNLIIEISLYTPVVECDRAKFVDSGLLVQPAYLVKVYRSHDFILPLIIFVKAGNK